MDVKICAILRTLPKDEKSIMGDQPTKIRILVAEDDLANQRVAELFLTRLGFEVVIAQNGEEAVRLAQKAPCALIIMDCQMPVMDGFEATRRIRASGIEVPIIAMTANFGVRDRERCLEVGMNDFVSKPVDFRLLTEALEKWIHSGC